MIGWRLTADIGSLLSVARQRQAVSPYHDDTPRPPSAYLTKAYPPDCLEGAFSAPLCQAAPHEGACESATRLLKTASETRLLRHRSASLRDLPSAIFLR